jgi:subfamily B ATP-binding cassette protein MsbA
MMKILKVFAIKDRHRRLLQLIKENRTKLLLAMGCMVMMASSTAASAYMIKPVLDDIFFQQNIGRLTLLPLVVVLIYIVRGIGMYGQEYFMTYVGESVIRHLRNDLYDRTCDLSLSFFHKEKTGALMSRITNDVNIIKAMVSKSVTGSLRDAFTIIGLTGVIFYQDWKMALFAFIILPVAFLPIFIFGRRVRQVSTGCQESMAELNSFLQETFLGNKIVKAFGMEAYEKKRFHKMTENLFALEIKGVIARSISSPVMEFLGGLGIAFIIWYGGYKVITGASTAGTFFSFMGAVIMLYDPVKKLSKLNNAVQEGLAAADRVFDIIETETEIKEAENPLVLQRQNHGVVFENVSFKYDKGMVLQNINLSVTEGEILALVGMSGGGKTSLVNLIPRFYDVTKGAVKIDGIDIRNISIASLRHQIAIVTQEPILFNDSIKNNIAYGNPNASFTDIENAAQAAYAYDFINAFPKKFETNMGELGGRVSGGEKQRICIARALLKDAPILILDEATSSLDTESEMLVQKALENLMQGRTTFVIAHRLSTINYAHRIIVLVSGKVVEEGTQEELLCRQGEYCKLYRMQFANQNSANVLAHD